MIFVYDSSDSQYPEAITMPRGILYQNHYRPQLSGHETFPLRYDWLKKAYDAVRSTETQAHNHSVFTGADAIARFGVGKNMVSSIRHWATVSGIIRDAPHKKLETTPLGQRLFARTGLDPYMEHPSTSWLIHWNLCTRSRKTTWIWAFNYFPSLLFERDQLIQSLERLALERNWTRAAATTIRRDVACFLRTYARQHGTPQTSMEDVLESPLTELGLIRPMERRDSFRFVRGPKVSLGYGVFCYAIADFWNSLPSTANTLSFEMLAHEPGSPGRVFQLGENDVIDLLGEVEQTSDGYYRWSETAGLKQLVRETEWAGRDRLTFLEKDYANRAGMGMA